MLDIILSEPFVVTKREAEKALGSNSTFEHVLRLVGEKINSWLFSNGVPIDVQTFGDPVNTVKCSFPDGKVTTAVCKEGDTFNLEVGIGLCIAKHQLGNSFLRTIRKAKKVYANGQKAAERRAKNLEELKELEARKKAKSDKRREQRREKRIEEQTEAIIRAALYLESLDDEDDEIDIPEKPELTEELVQKMREKNND